MNCVIVGGGIIGLLTARELAGSGVAVTVVERGECGQESSWAGGGILSPLYPWRLPGVLKPLLDASLALWPGLAAELKEETDCDPEWTRSGLLILGTDAAPERLLWATAHGVPMELVRGAALRELEPEVGAEAALWLPTVAQVRNPRLLRALRLSLIRRRVRIAEHTEVTGLLLEEGRVAGVQTAAGAFRADRTVIASGAWSGSLLHRHGISMPIVPVRGQMLVHAPGPLRLRRMLLQDDCYLIPRRDGRILVGSTVEYVGFDKSTTEEARDRLRQAAAKLVPGLTRLQLERQWAGLRPAAPEGVPYICPIPAAPGLFVNTGHFRNGVALAPASARLMADMILRRPPCVDARPFSTGEDPDRGAGGRAAEGDF